MANKVISSINAGSGDIGVFTTPYGVCSTGASTAAKTVTVNGDFALETGARVIVQFKYGNSASTITLNVNSTGAKDVWLDDDNQGSYIQTYIKAGWLGRAYEFIYDGTQYRLLTYDSNTIYTAPTAFGKYVSASGIVLGTNLVTGGTETTRNTVETYGGGNSIVAGNGNTVSKNISLNYLFGENNNATDTSDEGTSEGVSKYNFFAGYGNRISETYPRSMGSVAIGLNNIVASNKTTSPDTMAKGTTSYAYGSVALGTGNTVGSGSSAGYAVGGNNTVSGAGSIAMGRDNTSSASNTQSFGYNNTSSGSYTTTIGASNQATYERATAVGNGNTSTYTYASTFGTSNAASGTHSTAIGSTNDSTGSYSTCVGYNNDATNSYATAVGSSNKSQYSNGALVGCSNTSTNSYGYALGHSNTVGGYNGSVTGTGTAIGYNNTVSGSGSTAIGQSNTISASNYSTAIGYSHSVTGANNFVGGYDNTVYGTYNTIIGSDISLGYSTSYEGHYCTLFGRGHRYNYNPGTNGESSTNGSARPAYITVIGRFARYDVARAQNASSDSIPTPANTAGSSGPYLFVIGNGTSSSNYSTAAVVSVGGNMSIKGSYYPQSSADYAECFEWSDGNPKWEDRRGRFVTIDHDDTIRYANADDDYILGIISATPCVVGDSYNLEWQGRYKKDVYGQILYEDCEIEAEYDEEGNEIVPATIVPKPIDVEEYDSEKEYIPRLERPEWATVGMLGKLVLDDDGTCEVGGFAAPGKDGIATCGTAINGYKVIARLDENHVRVIFR